MTFWDRERNVKMLLWCVLAELYEIFLSRAKEKWRSYSETSSVNDSESGRTPSRRRRAHA